ncbi:MAG TPA: SDR family oxidoreductase [Candidatus Dormibacteraeota bacterium]|nr:SDR family oxidoreductase [Candidatus Dormibacteraeota bacterium]
MDLGLRDTRALVTAASKGLGRACAAALAAEGARVFIVSRDEERLARTEREIGAAGHLAVDLSRPGGPEAAVEAAVRELDGLDILVCNAGGPPPGTFESTPLDAWEAGYRLTLMSAVRLARSALPHLKQSGRGRIVNITSISVRQPIPNLLLSNAFRSAVTAMAKTLAGEVASSGVTVNNLAPGTILTDRIRDLYGDDVEAASRGIPAGRLGDPAELGAACAFLCSLQAGYITGQTLGLDGGALLGVH